MEGIQNGMLLFKITLTFKIQYFGVSNRQLILNIWKAFRGIFKLMHFSLHCNGDHLQYIKKNKNDSV